MSEEDKDFRTIWISNDTFRKLIQVRYALTKNDGKARNPDDVVRELIELFWKEHEENHNIKV